jgi:hypothetical protein
MPDQRRRGPRTRVDGTRMTCRGASGERGRGRGLDLGEGGIFVQVDKLPAVGSRLSLEIHLASWPIPRPPLPPPLRHAAHEDKPRPDLKDQKAPAQHRARRCVGRACQRAASANRHSPGWSSAASGNKGDQVVCFPTGRRFARLLQSSTKARLLWQARELLVTEAGPPCDGAAWDLSRLHDQRG